MNVNFTEAINDLIRVYYGCVSNEFYDKNDIDKLDEDALFDMILVYMDCYMSKSYEEIFKDDICVLALEYYNIMCNSEGVDFYSNDNDIISNIKVLNSDQFFDFIMSNGKYLSDIFTRIISKHLSDFPLTEYPYNYIEDIIKNEKSLEIYKKLHSNLFNELDDYNNYISKNEEEKQLIKK